MSTNRKMLKVFSLIQFVLAVVSLILGTIMLAGAGAAEGGPYGFFGISFDAVTWTAVNGACFDVCGLLQLVCAVLGIHGSNRPSALGSHLLFSILVVIAGIAVVLVSSDLGKLTTPLGAGLAIVVGAVVAVYDARVRKELDR